LLINCFLSGLKKIYVGYKITKNGGFLIVKSCKICNRGGQVSNLKIAIWELRIARSRHQNNFYERLQVSKSFGVGNQMNKFRLARRIVD